MKTLILLASFILFVDIGAAVDVGSRVSDIWRKLSENVQNHVQRTFTCKKMFEECRGVPWQRCCGTMICYRESEIEIHRPFDKGYCVECIDHGQICQRDNQCCSPLTCIKDKVFDINGLCQPKLPSGERCTDDDDCISNNCMKKYVLNLEGSCQ